MIFSICRLSVGCRDWKPPRRRRQGATDWANPSAPHIACNREEHDRDGQEDRDGAPNSTIARQSLDPGGLSIEAGVTRRLHIAPNPACRYQQA
ncbi:hypothetical protein ACHMW4_19230 [Mesorhizobium sp. UC22_110]|uniref:hypothetical protein n=1 Tax=unclassified Mesorhizobium TaxID=325217 RepID=UPI0036730FAA